MMTTGIGYRDHSLKLCPREVFFSIQLKVMIEEETKEYHLKRLYELSLKSLGGNNKK